MLVAFDYHISTIASEMRLIVEMARMWVFRDTMEEKNPVLAAVATLKTYSYLMTYRHPAIYCASDAPP